MSIFSKSFIGKPKRSAPSGPASPILHHSTQFTVNDHAARAFHDGGFTRQHSPPTSVQAKPGVKPNWCFPPSRRGGIS
jgi:hypothetical protein